MKSELKVVYGIETSGINAALEQDLVAVAEKHGFGLMSFGTNGVVANQRDLNFYEGNSDPVLLPKLKVEKKVATPKAKATAKPKAKAKPGPRPSAVIAGQAKKAVKKAVKKAAKKAVKKGK